MKKESLFKISNIFLLFFSVAATSVFAEGNITNGVFGSPPVFQQSVNKSEVVDAGNFYYTNKGKKVSFLRKKNEYLLVRDHKKVASDSLSNTIQASFGNDVEIIKTHDFDKEIVIRLTAQTSKNSILSAIQAMDTSIEYVSPVFQNLKTKGNSVAITSRIIVKLKSMIDPQKLVDETTLTGKLSLNVALTDAHQEYEYKIISTINDAGDIFALTREVMDLPYVEWAEPVMLVKARSNFFPNDTLFNNQWHLHNTGQNGGVIDADIDAPEGWDLSKGDGAVVAIFDDGVQVGHPDLSIWLNPGEIGAGKASNGIDDDGNGYIDDYHGWDFVDGDNNPSPSASGEDHGTAVAGVAAAHGNNALGVTGSAINAEILAVKSGSMSCADWGNAMRYAGKYSDVVSNSWGISGCESTLNSAINDVVNGNIVGAKRGRKGTPVLFASGNSASGWTRFSLSGFSAGSYNFRWEFSKDSTTSEGYDTVWLDDITWPGGATSNFEGDALGNLPSGFTGSGNANWHVVNDGIHARGAAGKSVKAGTITDNQVTQLNITKTVGTGVLSYWAWVSSEEDYDFFNLYVNGTLYHHFNPGQNGHRNEVTYPASNPDTIAIGSSNDGGPGAIEERSYYSQFGSVLDVLAPSNGGFQQVTTTDRTGTDGYDRTSDYTNTFGGTSSATPLASGVVADILSLKPTLSATQLRNVLRLGTDKIGPYGYVNGKRNNFYGHGRVNLHSSLQEAILIEPERVVKRNEIAKIILKHRHGKTYLPPPATGSVFTDVSVGDFHADWVEQLKNEGLTEGCSANKYCPEMAVNNEQAAKLLLRTKYGSAFSPPPASGAVFSDVPRLSFAANWIEKLRADGITEGCDSVGSKYCPKMSVTWEGFDEMFFKLSP